ncbi:MAG TPA: hypothetical protein VGH65_04790 [Verrucomicrobiaceae bacterium]|jgi:hypothetical protein
MGRTISTWLLLLALSMSLGGCRLLGKWFPKKKKNSANAGTKDLYIGSIEMVNPEQRFVLVKTGLKLNLQTGWRLETRPLSGVKSVLTVSPEQKMNFLSADIVEGYPQKGDIVVLPPQGSLTPAAAPEAPANPQLPPSATSALPPPIP